MIPPPKQKRSAYLRTIGILLNLLWSTISAPVFYPVWYFNRVNICDRIYTVIDNWERIKWMICEKNDTKYAKYLLKRSGYFWYFLWLYGDIDDPLGWGGMPKTYRNGKNNFINRFMWSAIRNPRFNYNYMNLRTQTITHETTVVDTRTDEEVYSNGIGHSRVGKIIKWFYDGNRYYYIFEYVTRKWLFYIGWVGGVKQSAIGRNLRFEISFRKVSKNEEY